jgi:hypothetical protein
MRIYKGDVFKDKDGRELIFLGWWVGQAKITNSGALAIGTPYRGDGYEGIIAVNEEDIVLVRDWVSGFMIGEGT